MPKAAVNENGESRSPKDDVGPALKAGKDGDVGSVSHATPMKFLPKLDLRMCVSAPIGLHPGLSCS